MGFGSGGLGWDLRSGLKVSRLADTSSGLTLNCKNLPF